MSKRKRKLRPYFNVDAAERQQQKMIARKKAAESLGNNNYVDPVAITTELATDQQVKLLMKMGVSQEIAYCLTKYSAHRMIDRINQQRSKKKKPKMNVWEKAKLKTSDNN